MFLAFAAFAIDGTITFANRVKLQNVTEQTALAAAAEFNSTASVTEADIKSAANNTFNVLIQDGLKTATMTPTVDTDAKTVTIEATMISQPYFLAFLGISGINLAAKAEAVSETLDVTASYTGINWLTTNAAYRSDILSTDLNLSDTAILLPLGDQKSISYDETTGYANFGYLNDDNALSLGPGGFITIKLPAPIINKPGYDLYIGEAGGALEGYLVFVGLDNDPDNPYVNSSNPGAGISWANITCSGESAITDTNGGLVVYNSITDNIGTQEKFYGSGYFNLGDNCVGGISMAKYLRIVDDNVENGFVTTATTPNKYYKAMLYGESSTYTPGADIDFIKVLNHVRLQ